MKITSPLFQVMVIFLLCVTPANLYADASIWYVDVDSTTTSPDGVSWDTAFPKIQDAVDAAVKAGASPIAPAEVWVKEGVYTGWGDNPYQYEMYLGVCVLVLYPHVHVYGGFLGNETNRMQRDWQKNATIIDGEEEYRGVFGANDATLDGFTIRRGSALTRTELNNRYSNKGGGFLNCDTSPTVRNCVFEKNEETRGSGMYNQHSSPTLENCVFINNQPKLLECKGGAIYNKDASPHLLNCTFSNNVTEGNGAGIYNQNSSPVLQNCRFTTNFSKSNGGAIYDLDSCSTVESCTFSKNAADKDGGAICHETKTADVPPSRITGCAFSENRAENDGGAICHTVINPNPFSPILDQCTFTQNRATHSGGALAGGGFAKNCLFVENVADVDGGGVFVASATDCRFEKNFAKRNGGGLCNGFATNCLFIDNTAQVDGGGMCWSGAVNSTFFGNTAQGNGGGVYDRYSVFLTNCIVWGNSAEKEGQAIYPVHAEAPRVTYSCIEGGYTGEGNIDMSPLFVNPGEGDVSLQTGSPCIDAGTAKDAPTTDIQGTSRPQGNGVDMGAYEWITDKTK